MKLNDSRILFAPGTIPSPEDPPIFIADALRTPENVGSLIRLAANVGSKKVLLLNAADLKRSKMKKTACMAWDYVQLIESTTEHLQELLPRNYNLVAVETSPQATNLFTTPLPRRTAFVLGSEVLGISEPLLQQCPQHVFIPMTGPDTSMNITHAASVALFEWLRRFQSLPAQSSSPILTP